MGRISRGPTRWPPGAERRLVPAKSNLKTQTFYGLYLVTGVTGGGITACCSPTLGVEVNIAHKYLKQWPFSLSVNPDSESDEFQAEAANEDEELEAEETDQRDVRDEMGQSLPVYDVKEMHTQGNYLVESILQARYKQGWRFLVEWQGYGTADSIWEPVKAFVLEGGRVNEVFARFCIEHQPRYNSALKKCRELSQRLQKKKEKRGIQDEEAEDLPPPSEDLPPLEEDTGDGHQEPDSGEHAARMTGVTLRKSAR